MTWKPYNPTWLVELAKAQMPEEAWLVDALSQCTSYLQSGHAYIHFIDPTASNKPGSQWQFERNILLYDKYEGELVLDILEGNRVGGVEFLNRL
ncbi:hypothetical protein [Leptolyngbya sp. FACHB-711]|uniref:hypothetical protein n=1 Tax=Leptolyngbya sp. FACHB-711 TaxID=2692813 RepID=UPI00168639B4|nr:hypothetical protein [Leptolyngbya sp. FACHB-711]MBD2023788.1 hypothetical protein [Leptolyngbya sp. FACHB-711]